MIDIDNAILGIFKDICSMPDMGKIQFIPGSLDRMPYIKLLNSGINYGCVAAFYSHTHATYLMDGYTLVHTLDIKDPAYKEKIVEHIRKMALKYV